MIVVHTRVLQRSTTARLLENDEKPEIQIWVWLNDNGRYFRAGGAAVHHDLWRPCAKRLGHVPHEKEEKTTARSTDQELAPTYKGQTIH